MAKAYFTADFVLSRVVASLAAIETAREMAHEKRIVERMKNLKGFLRKHKTTREEAIADYEGEDAFWPEREVVNSKFNQYRDRVIQIRDVCLQIKRAGDDADGYIQLDAEELSLLDFG